MLGKTTVKQETADRGVWPESQKVHTQHVTNIWSVGQRLVKSFDHIVALFILLSRMKQT